MSFFQFDMAGIPAAISALSAFIKENPILCGVLFLSYGLFYLYMFINNKAVDSDVYEIDLLSSGISTVMVAMLLIGLDESSKGFDITSLDFGNPTTKVAVFLLCYAAFLILFAFIKKLPKFLVVILGNSELDLLINFTAILMTDPEIEVSGTLLLVIALPLAVLFIIQRIRRMFH